MKKKDNKMNFISRIFGFSMASWVNCLISLLATPITTAVFTPEELGKVNMLISYSNIIIPFVYMGFDQAYLRFHNEPLGKNSSDSMFKICLLFSLVLTISVTIVTAVMWKSISAGIIGYAAVFIYISLMLYVIANLLMRYVSLKTRMDNNIGLYFIQSVASTVIIKISFVGVAFIRPTAEYAILLRSGLLFAASFIFAVILLKKCDKVKIDYSKDVIKVLLKYGLPLFPTVFIIMLNTSLAQLVLKNYVDYEMIGIYSNAVTMASTIAVVQAGLNTFWVPFVYEYQNEQSKIQKMHHIISYLLLTCGFLIIAFQDLIYMILVNKQYWASRAIMGLLMIAPISETISETLGIGIELSKRTYMKFPIYVVSVLINAVSCLILIPRFGIVGAALANAISSLTMLIMKSVIGEHYYRCSDNYIRLILCMTMFVAVAILSNIFTTGCFYILIAFFGVLLTTLIYSKTVALLLENIKAFLIRK